MRLTASHDNFNDAIADIESSVARSVTTAMRTAGTGLKNDLRAQITAAGLSTRLANTWRSNVYPQFGNSLDPAALVYSKAPNIIASMVDSVTIRARNGAKFLAIPTANTPNTRGARGATRPMTPAEVEVQFNQDLTILKGRSGHWLAFVKAVAARSQKGFRRATPGRLKQGRDLKMILMFVLVPQVITKKRLDLDATANKWAGQASILIDQALS